MGTDSYFLKKLYGLTLRTAFYCFKDTESPLTDSLHFTTKPPGVPGTHLIDFE